MAIHERLDKKEDYQLFIKQMLLFKVDLTQIQSQAAEGQEPNHSLGFWTTTFL